jgi:DHA3 family macrolide efflux protein-like MFS transporter
MTAPTEDRRQAEDPGSVGVPLPHFEGPAGPPRLLSNRPLVWLVVGEGLFSLGRWGFVLAVIGDATYTFGASAAEVGFLLAAFSLPLILVSPVHGTLADRWSAKWLLVLASASTIPVLAVAALASSLAGLYVTAALYGVFHAAMLPARGALVPRLVPRDSLVPANGMFSAATSLTLLVGPALGAILVSVGGRTAPYVVAATSAAIATGPYLAVPDRRADTAEPAATGLARTIRSMTAGFADAWRRPVLRRLFLVVMAIWFLVGLVIALEPLYVKGVLGGGQAFLGVIWAVFGGGEMIGSLALARVRAGTGRESTLIGWGLLVGGLGLLLYTSLASPAAAIAGNVLFGVGFAFFTVSGHALIQRLTDRPGRVEAAVNMAGEFGPLVASAVLATAAGLVSVQPWMVGSAIAFVVVALLALASARRTRAVPAEVRG